MFRCFSSGAFVNKLTRGTTIIERIIAIAPMLIGEARFSLNEAACFVSSGKSPNPNRIMCPTVMPMPRIKLVHTAGLEIFLLKRPNINGPRNAPASAPHEYDIRVEIEAFLLKAIITEIMRNTAISTLMIITSFFSSCFFILGFIKSIVSVELDVSTSDERVDIEAERTRTTTSPIKISGRAVWRSEGIIASNSGFPFAKTGINTLEDSLLSRVQKSLSKPPRRYYPPATKRAKIVEIIVPFFIALSSFIA